MWWAASPVPAPAPTPPPPAAAAPAGLLVVLLLLVVLAPPATLPAAASSLLEGGEGGLRVAVVELVCGCALCLTPICTAPDIGVCPGGLRIGHMGPLLITRTPVVGVVLLHAVACCMTCSCCMSCSVAHAHAVCKSASGTMTASASDRPLITGSAGRHNDSRSAEKRPVHPINASLGILCETSLTFQDVLSIKISGPHGSSVR